MKKLSCLMIAILLAGCAAFENIKNPLRSPDNHDCMNMNSFKVFQVLDDNTALAYENDGNFSSILDKVVLLQSFPNIDYYDGMIVDVPHEMCAIQQGVYKYETKGGNNKTVPMIDFEYMYNAKNDEESSKRVEETLNKAKYRIYSGCQFIVTNKTDKKKCACISESWVNALVELKEKGNLNFEKERSGIIRKVEKKCGAIPKEYKEIL